MDNLQIQQYERLIHWVVRRCCVRVLPRADRIQAARIGIWKALPRLSPAGGSTYLVAAMVNEIRRTARRERGVENHLVRTSDTVAAETVDCNDGSDADYVQHVRGIARGMTHHGRKGIAEWSHLEILDRVLAGETLDSIGRSYGFCRERVRQIVKEIHAQAREYSDG
jgi:RNA polymerase sigma factor (sigma-70 family)